MLLALCFRFNFISPLRHLPAVLSFPCPISDILTNTNTSLVSIFFGMLTYTSLIFSSTLFFGMITFTLDLLSSFIIILPSLILPCVAPCCAFISPYAINLFPIGCHVSLLLPPLLFIMVLGNYIIKFFPALIVFYCPPTIVQFPSWLSTSPIFQIISLSISLPSYMTKYFVFNSC